MIERFTPPLPPPLLPHPLLLHLKIDVRIYTYEMIKPKKKIFASRHVDVRRWPTSFLLWFWLLSWWWWRGLLLDLFLLLLGRGLLWPVWLIGVLLCLNERLIFLVIRLGLRSYLSHNVLNSVLLLDDLKVCPEVGLLTLEFSRVLEVCIQVSHQRGTQGCTEGMWSQLVKRRTYPHVNRSFNRYLYLRLLISHLLEFVVIFGDLLQGGFHAEIAEIHYVMVAT